MAAPRLEINPSSQQLDAFHAWLLENGRSPTTAKIYRGNVVICSHAKGGWQGRLTNRELAPKTLHANAAALRSYAAFLEDGKLLVAIKRVKLPASRRKTPKLPLPAEVWSKLITAIEDDPRVKPVMRATLLIMALRGLRIGDALKLRREELATALRTGKLGFEAKGRARLEYGIAQFRDAVELLLDDDREWERVVDLIAWHSKAKTLEQKLHVGREKVRRQLKRIAAGVVEDNVYNHRLRRTYATHFLKQLEGDPQAILKLQKHMGWAEIQTAMGYVDAVDVDELEDIGANLIKGVRKKKGRGK